MILLEMFSRHLCWLIFFMLILTLLFSFWGVPCGCAAWMVLCDLLWALLLCAVRGLQGSSEIHTWWAQDHCPQWGGTCGWAVGAGVVGLLWGWIRSISQMWLPVRFLVVPLTCNFRPWPLNNFSIMADCNSVQNIWTSCFFVEAWVVSMTMHHLGPNLFVFYNIH